LFFASIAHVFFIVMVRLSSNPLEQERGVTGFGDRGGNPCVPCDPWFNEKANTTEYTDLSGPQFMEIEKVVKKGKLSDLDQVREDLAVIHSLIEL
jgi:hypothetical protein